MRICQLRIKNLNSLAGSWLVDFDALAAQHGGLFAITGPTGSGKSTLLDGICLALFGRTPRLKDVNSSGNEMMTRHCGDCLAEVTFETPAGRFRALWSQRRARGGASGKLQPQRHELSQLDAAGTGVILESKVSQVPVRIKELCGMDFDQFTRSVFLPQGGFAAFLKASSAERAELLEGLTGTELYAQISRKVHELTRQQAEELKNIRTRKEELPLLSEEEERTLREKLSFYAEEARHSEEAQRACQQDLSLWQQHIELEKLRCYCHEKEEEMEPLEEQAKTWLPRLEADRRGRSFVDEWKKLLHFESNLIEQEMQRRQQSIELQLVQQDVADTKMKLQELIVSQDAQRQKMEFRLPLLAQVLQLDEELLQLEHALLTQKGEVDHQERTLRQQQFKQNKAMAELQKKVEQARQCHARIQQRNESVLYSSRHFWSQWIETWASLYRYRESHQGETRDFSVFSDGKQVLEEVVLRHLRHSLRDKAPCPLCGSLDHPVRSESEDSSYDDNFFATLVEEMANHLKSQQYLAARKQLSGLIEALDCGGDPDPEAVSCFWHTVQRQWEFEDEEAQAFEQNEAERFVLEELTRLVAQEELKYELSLQRYSDGLRKVEEQRIKRQSLFSGDAAKERRLLELEREALESQKGTYSQVLESQDQQERKISVELARLEGFLSEGKASLDRQKRAFELALKEQGFLSCEEWQNLLLEDEERCNLESQSEQLVDHRKYRDDLLQELHRREAEIPPMPEIGQDVLNRAVAIHQSYCQNAYETIGQCREALRVDDVNRQRSQTLYEALEAQREHLNRWEQLHDLIGSADGKKFRSFVQGLSFRSLVTQASTYLQDMHGRYELLPSRSDSLDLEVRDLWQAGEIRSVQNLSGGETFMVSLALALALSGTGHRQETLFLDEGFGALDDESLDLVLDALEKLRQRGRIIGVISHVAVLCQRISCQIRLTQNQGGRSSLSGPGCSQHD